MKLKKHIIYTLFVLIGMFYNSSAQKNNEIFLIKKELALITLKDFDKSVLLANKGIDLALKEMDSISYAYFLRYIGSAYYFKGNYTKASDYFFESISLLEKKNEKAELGYSYNELAKLYRKTRKLNLAKDFYNKALTIFTALGDSTNMSTIYNESGVVYEYEKNYNEALKRYQLSLQISERLNDSVAISYAINNIAGIYSIQNNYKIAQRYLIKALEIRKLLKDSFALAINYTDLGFNSISNQKYNEALRYLDSSTVIVKKINYLELESQNYSMMSTAFDNNGNIGQAYLYYKKYITLKDSIFTQESDKQLNELNTKYQTEKKDLELAKNKIDIVTEKNKRYVTYGALAFFIILFSIAIWAFIQKRKNGRVLESKNNLLENANQEISHQKEQLTEKQQEIVDSINYAKKIQDALLANEELLLANKLHHFILFKPKDIVSGDFTWATKKDNLLYLACCDSTGHGVPGAFMSILNIGFLNEAIKERSILEPGKIFDYVRARLIETISNDQQKDGFDGILICIDESKHTISYAAAHNAPILIRGNELQHLSCNKMPVGKGIKEDLFDTFTLNYLSDDKLYLFTDGYPDQFGGEKGKKFKYKQFENLLLDNNCMQLAEQSSLLNTAFENWRGNLEQVDDVCIIGISL